MKDNCETDQHERTVFFSRQKPQKIEQNKKTVYKNLINQHRLYFSPKQVFVYAHGLEFDLFIVSFPSKFYCRHQGKDLVRS